jgi:hypothetical protein
MTTDGSMAVWSEHRTGCSGASAKVHFNYWRLAGNKAFVPKNGKVARDFVKVGVLLNNPNDVERVNIYLPGK